MIRRTPPLPRRTGGGLGSGVGPRLETEEEWDQRRFYETVLSKDMEVIQPLREMPYGREFYIRDPDAYILGFMDVTT